MLMAALAFTALFRGEAPTDGYAQLYWADGRMAAVYRTHIEFYRYGGVTPAVVRDEHDARPLLPGVSVRGAPAFLDARGKRVDMRPETRHFPGELFQPPEKAAGSKAISVCAVSGRGFCGVLGLEGRELVALRTEEEAGVTREPVGSMPDGTEALFALTRHRAEGKDRVVVGYRLWRQKKRQAPREEVLAPDDPQVQVMLESYEGSLVLPAPGDSLHFFRKDRRRR